MPATVGDKWKYSMAMRILSKGLEIDSSLQASNLGDVTAIVALWMHLGSDA